MTRGITSALDDELAADALKPIFLWHGQFGSGPLRLWTGYGDLTALGETWTGSGTFGGASLIQESTEIRADGVRFMLSGMDPAIIDIAENEEYQQRPCSLYFAALTPALTVVADPYEIFTGAMDVMRHTEGAETANVWLSAENELAVLERPKLRRNTPEDHQADYPTDTFFDYVADLQDKEIILT